MQRFGIEIRKAGSTKGLYEDIDRVLGKFKIPSQGVTDDVQSQSVAHSLQKMLQVDQHFSVCTIKSCADVVQICIPKERMNIYQAIHCVHWNEMLPDYRQIICAMVLDDFRSVLMV